MGIRDFQQPKFPRIVNCLQTTSSVLHGNSGRTILLGAILAPTDPVLASEVQISHPDDLDELRFGLTSEGGLNDALAFPFVYFGLRWLKDAQWQNWAAEWVMVDLVWAIAAGLAMGIIVARSVIWVYKKLHFNTTYELV